MASMSGFVLALFTVAVVLTGQMYFLMDGSEAYGVTFDNETMANYDQLQELNSQAENLKQRATQIQTSQNALDVIGAYLTSAYSALTTLDDSIDVFISMSDTSFQTLQLPVKYTNTLKTYIMGTILLLIAVVFLTYFVKVKI